jgi:hypothetical protein
MDDYEECRGCEDCADELAEVRADLAAAIKVLRAVEWQQYYDGETYAACPCCGGAETSDDDDGYRGAGHADDCELARLTGSDRQDADRPTT